MFTLAAKLLEILAAASGRLLDYRRTASDADVARALVGIVLLLQQLCVRGEHLLVLARRFVDGPAEPGSEADFDATLRQQADAISEIRGALMSVRPLFATIDASLYVELAPFLDAKSGLLTRWEQQRQASTFSTTTLFFLSNSEVDRLAGVGTAGATEDGLSADRTDLVMTMADTIRKVRSREVRDIRRLGPEQLERLEVEIEQARVQLGHARELCGQLLATTEAAVGPDAMARLRRAMMRESAQD